MPEWVITLIIAAALFGAGSALGEWLASSHYRDRISAVQARSAAREQAIQVAADGRIAENAEREALDARRYRGIQDDQTKELDTLRGRVLVNDGVRERTLTYVYRDRLPGVAAASPSVFAAGARWVSDPRASAIVADTREDEADARRADELAINLRACYARALADRAPIH